MQLTTIATFDTPIEAHIVMGLLRSHGVEAQLHGANFVQVDYLLAQALGGVRLQVLERDEERAQILLRRYRAGELECLVEEECGLSPESCQHCGGRQRRPLHSLRSALNSLVAFVLTGAIVPRRPIRFVCGACGAQLPSPD